MNEDKKAIDEKKNEDNMDKACEDYLNGWKRCLADFENYKKAEAERLGMGVQFVKEDILFEFLRVYDNFARIKEHLPPDLQENDWAKGVLMVRGQFKEALKQQGLEEIKAKGEKFDPVFHEAVEEIIIEGKESGTVAQVVQKGYMLNGRVLRPVKVKVSKQQMKN